MPACLVPIWNECFLVLGGDPFQSSLTPEIEALLLGFGRQLVGDWSGPLESHRIIVPSSQLLMVNSFCCLFFLPEAPARSPARFPCLLSFGFHIPD